MQYDSDKSRRIKNTLIIGSNIVLLRVNNIEDDIKAMTNNFIGGGCRIQKEIKELAGLCRTINKNMYIAVYKEFRDGVYPHAALNSNDGIILYTVTLQ